ncbi:hypothetical protein RvY_10548-2 [Ramazzottius varieornatus]|uniref:Uncharacterized protein n=1 Tax=Ramazzottius varieornatus TaxID=947166 RepID=A0A1D1VHL1_RAMVA|nr:hypothetical protein RvY_10548-2 [Ramazzottius varieornatus]
MEPWNDSSNLQPLNGLELPPGMVLEIETDGSSNLIRESCHIPSWWHNSPHKSVRSFDEYLFSCQFLQSPTARMDQTSFRRSISTSKSTLWCPPAFLSSSSCPLQDIPTRPRTTFYHGSQHACPSNMNTPAATSTVQANLGAAQNLIQILYRNSAFLPLLAPYLSPRPSLQSTGETGTNRRTPITVASPPPGIKVPAFITQVALTAIYESYVRVEQKDAGLAAGLYAQGVLEIRSAQNAVVRCPGMGSVSVSGAMPRNSSLGRRRCRC